MSDGALPAPAGHSESRTRLVTPLRAFVRTETGSAAVLLVAALVAVVWVNVDGSSYDAVWRARLSLRLNDWSLSLDARQWVNSGLMTFFFFVVGLEARRELDIGELREHARMVAPFLAGIGGMVVPVGIFLLVNLGGPGTGGWGTAMSTDTAFALGVLAVVGRRFPDRLRAFMLTVVVVDDLLALLVIATAYTDRVELPALLTAVGLFAVLVVAARVPVRGGWFYGVFGVATWVAMTKSGVEPVVVGLAMGLLTYAYPAGRSELEQATESFRLFREQPTPELARQARVGVDAAISPNDRLQRLYHPWTSYVIVPAFALANAGVRLGGGFVGRAVTSPITIGIAVGYVVGKPIGIAGTSWLVTRATRGRLRPPVGWASVAAGGAMAGVAFTVSLLIASLAFRGERLDEAKAGVLAAAVLAALLTTLVARATDLLPRQVRIRALLGDARTIVDLADPVDVERDHVRGPADAPVTLVEYGDLECPYCGQAEPIVRELLAEQGDLRYVWRHLPLTDVHPHAQLAAEAAEAAAAQGSFWEMHDLLLERQDALRARDLTRYAGEIGLDVERFTRDLKHHAGAARVARDVDGADLSAVAGTPTFFVNGRRHYGAYDIDTLTAVVRAARVEAEVAS